MQRSWGTMLDQEEAVAYLVCDVVGLEILPEEARPIGKAAVKAVYEPKRGKTASPNRLPIFYGGRLRPGTVLSAGAGVQAASPETA